MRTWSMFFVLATLLTGCGEFDILRIRLFTHEQADGPIGDDSQHAELVREAVGILGYETRFVTRSRGAVTLDLHDAGTHPIQGRTLQTEGCHRAAWVNPLTAQHIAHELGHTLGLAHHDAANNLMSRRADPENVELTAEQDAVVDFNVKVLGRC